MKDIKMKFCRLLLFCLLLSVHGLCMAEPIPQTITTGLEQAEAVQRHLTALESNNSELRELLTALGEDLTEATEQSQSLKDQIQLLKEQSKEQRETILVLREQLTGLKADSKELSSSLRIANEELQRAKESCLRREKELGREKKKNKILFGISTVLAAVVMGSTL